MPKEDAEPVLSAVVTPFNDGNQEFPVPVQEFINSLTGSQDEVWGLWLKRQHKHEAHTMGMWKQLLDSHRHKPAHPSVL